MPTLASVVADLLVNPVPVLFLDTCAVLDIIRGPTRKQADHLERVLRIRAAATATPAICRPIVASITVHEFGDNCTNVEGEMQRFLDALRENANQVYSACGFLNVTSVAPSHSAFPLLLGELLRLAQDLMSQSSAIEPDIATMQNARSRVVMKKRPVRGGDGYKDSEIVEVFLELARQLRGASFAPPLVFLSSNTADFCETDKQTLHADLEQDFTPLNIQFARIWPEAHQLLGI
jgi:hypothetical protein